MKMRYTLLAFMLWALTACTGNAPQVLRVGYNNWPGYELIWLADKLGYFKEVNLQVEHVQFVALADAKRAYERGQLDAVGVTDIELLQIANNPNIEPAQATLVLDISNGADQVLACADIAQLSDIKAKRFAVEADSVSVQLAALLVQQAGLSQQDIHWVVLQPAQMDDAMKAGQIDLAATYAPHSLNIQQNTTAKVLFSSADVPNAIVDLLAINRQSLQVRAQSWQLFVKAVMRAIDYYHTHPQQAAQLMAAHAGMSVADMQQTLSGLIIPTNAQQTRLLLTNGEVAQGMLAVQQLLSRLGILVSTLPPAQLINPFWQSAP